MNYQELIDDLRCRINPQYVDCMGTESYERKQCLEAIESLLAENERLKAELAKYRDAPVVAWQERQQTKTGYTGWYDSGAKTSMGKGPTKSEVINGVEYQWRPLIVKPGENNDLLP